MRAAVTGDATNASELYDTLDESGRTSYNMFVVAMFAGAMTARFEADQSLEAVQRFATEMKRDFPDAQPPVKPLTVELVIRGMLGEEHLFDEVGGGEQIRIQLLATRKIINDSAQMTADIEEYLSDAARLASQWESELR